jgi:hypothetical protein
MGNQVPLLGVIPEPTDIFNQFAVVIDQRVIDGDHAVRGVVRAGVALQQIEPPLVEGFFIPINLSERAVQAGLVSCDGKLAVDTADGFAFRNE